MTGAEVAMKQDPIPLDSLLKECAEDWYRIGMIVDDVPPDVWDSILGLAWSVCNLSKHVAALSKRVEALEARIGE